MICDYCNMEIEDNQNFIRFKFERLTRKDRPAHNKKFSEDFKFGIGVKNVHVGECWRAWRTTALPIYDVEVP